MIPETRSYIFSPFSNFSNNGVTEKREHDPQIGFVRPTRAFDILKISCSKQTRVKSRVLTHRLHVQDLKFLHAFSLKYANFRNFHPIFMVFF